MIAHLKARAAALAALGWTGADAEWLAFVCLQSGAFLRSQYLRYVGESHPMHARRFVQRCRSIAVEVPWNGSAFLVCRIVAQPVYRALGVENFQISPVPEDASSPREGLGHYHLGYNTECLPAGEIIPAADPWTHFGDGSDGMEMQLEGGEYRFSVQIGDDEHRTIEGLCETITIRMEDGI